MSTGDPTFDCPSCGKRFRWKPEFAGKKVRCKCDGVVSVPEYNPAEPDPFGVEDDSLDLAAINQLDDSPSKGDAAMGAKSTCPSCGAGVNASAVICMQCGFNIQEGKATDTVVAKAVQKGGGGARQGRRIEVGSADGFFGRMRRSWGFAKLSYGIIWEHKSLMLFPLISGIATIVVLASFLLPLWGSGKLAEWMAFLDEDSGTNEVPLSAYGMTFTFYFLCYFVIVFFNTALTAAAMKVCDGEKPSLKYGLSVACRRWYQITSWAMFSACIGVLLKVIENSHEKVGKFVAALLGSAWTVMTYFVVPVLCTEGVGPIQAVKDSVKTMSQNWGTALVGNFSLGLLSFLFLLPVYLILAVLFYLSMGNPTMVGVVIALIIFVTLFAAVSSSAADVVFKALLYNYATGRNIPADLDDDMLERAFAAGDD